MAFRDSGWVGGGVLDAQETRLATGGLVMPGAGPIQARSGVKPAAGSPGLVAQTVTASAGVLVNSLQGMIQGTRSTSAGAYLVTSDAQFTLDILAGAPADPTNPRNDLIIARQKDTQWADASTAFTVERVGGTPAGSPVDPTVTGDYIPLARVRVNAAVTTITNAVITDLRPWTVATGGVLPVTSKADRDGLSAYAGLAVWRMDTIPQRLEVFDSSAAQWVIIGPKTVTAEAHNIQSLATVTETVIATLTIPAGDAVAGSVYELVAAGAYTTSATPGTVTMRIRLGGIAGAVVATAAAADGTLLASKTNQGITYHARLTCVASGATGTWFATASVVSGALSTGAMVIRNPGAPGATAAVTRDSTISNDLVVTVNHGSATNTLDVFQRYGQKVL